MKWWLFAIALLLLALMMTRERFVETPGPGTRPSLSDGGWRSKIDAAAPIGGNKADYERALQSFYDTIYSPLRTENPEAMPKDTQVEEFLNTQPATIDKGALRQIILSGFAIDRTTSAAAREQKQVRFNPSEALEPRDGVLQTWKRTEPDYTPSDTRIGDLPEGVYKPTRQQDMPRREGDPCASTSWTGQRPYSLTENVVKG
jgi:hypothetical protein